MSPFYIHIYIFSNYGVFKFQNLNFFYELLDLKGVQCSDDSTFPIGRKEDSDSPLSTELLKYVLTKDTKVP